MSVPRLLMPSAGRKVTLMRSLKPYFEVYPGGLSPRESSACGLLEPRRFVELPRASSPSFPDALLAAVARLGINVILPVRNDDMDILSRMSADLAGAGARVVMSPPETLAHCLDKLALYRKLSRHHIHTPYTEKAGRWRELPEDPFPLFVKARCGAGSVVAQAVRTPEELGAILVHHDPDKLVVQPLLFGEEYTVDMFYDLDGVLLQAVLRRRTTVLNGQMDSGEVAKHLGCDSFRKVLRVGDFMKFVGPINLQFIKSEDNCYITDINPRFSGGVGLTIASGADFPLYLRQMLYNMPIGIQEARVGARAVSYTDYVYG